MWDDIYSLIKDVEGETSILQEDESSLRVINAKLTKTLFDALSHLNRKAATYISISLTGEVYREISLSDPPSEHVFQDNLTLLIKKNNPPHKYFFFTEEGFREVLTKETFTSSAKVVWLYGLTEPFETITTRFTYFGDDINRVPEHWPGLDNPRKLVRDLTISEEGLVPNDLKFWIVPQMDSLMESKFVSAWKDIALTKLISSLPTEISFDNSRKVAMFSGPRRVELLLPTFEHAPEDMFRATHDCVLWIYEKAEEASSKHAIFSYQVALDSQGGGQWIDPTIMSEILVNAKEAYKLHLHQSCKELLDNLTELKKSLHDDVVQINQNTRTIILNLSKDFILAVGVLVLKFLQEKDNFSPEGIQILIPITIGFLLINLTVTLVSNYRFNQISETTRNGWRKRLYPYISDDEYNCIAQKPIHKGLCVYRKVVFVVIVLYMILILLLIYII